MEVKICTDCGLEKPITDFPKRKSEPVGFRDTSLYSPCKDCNTQRQKEWREQNRGYRGSGRNTKYLKEDRPLISAIRTRLREARTRIKKFDKVETNLTEEYLFDLFKNQQGKCALLGYDMKIERKHSLSLSLDQIEPNKGYVVGNVQWVTWVANRAKGDMTQDDFYRMCQIAIDNRKVQRLSKSSNS